MLRGAARGLVGQVDLRYGTPLGAAGGGGSHGPPEPEPLRQRTGARGWLSLDEKATLTAGADVWHTTAVPRLGIPPLRLTDGPSGVRGIRFAGDPTTCLPCGPALGATWDRDLVQRVGRLLGDEARDKGVHVLLAPTVNLHRHPLGGRNFESFSEDPFLTAELACAYVRGVQERGVACAVKHFVASEQEHGRTEVSVEVDERTLREVYLQPFEAVVRLAGVWAVMTAYNRLHGVHCSEHPGLLQTILRDDWGFDGLVVSDWYGTYSTAAVAAGLDLEMPGPPRFLGHYVAAAVRQGDLTPDPLDRSSRALLTLIERAHGAGEREPPGGDRGDRGDGGDPEVRGEDASGLAREVAREAIVLLRNEEVAAEPKADAAIRAEVGSEGSRPARHRVLPLDPARVRSIAVLGPKADRPDIQGEGSAHVHPTDVVTPLEGIRRHGDARGVAVTYEPGVAQPAPAPLGARELRVPGADEPEAEPQPEPGLLVEYFAGSRIEGAPLHREVLPETDLVWLGSPLPDLPAGRHLVETGFSVRATAVVVVDRPGRWRFTLSSAGRSRVLLDGECLIDNRMPVPGDTFFGRGSTEVEGEAELSAGTEHRLLIELHTRPQEKFALSGVTLTAQPPPDPDALLRAVAAAQRADVAVAVVGAAVVDRAGADRPTMDLPEDQVALLRAVAAVNHATVVVVDTAGPVTMGWVDEVAAVLQLWYPGQEGGAALAEVLFGDADAAGRLPTTFPGRIEDTPAFPFYPGDIGRLRYGEGLLVGYRHYDAHDVEPRFCFGHGLSYTQIAYGPLELEAVPRDGGGDLADDSSLCPVDGPVFVRLQVDVTNVGERAGSEVVQVYVRDVQSAATRPEQELKQFAKVRLAPGETGTVRLDLPRRAFAFWDVAHHDWAVEPGEFEIRVGSSSRRIHRTARVRLP